jgi:RHS repeat-associated protein
MMVLVYDLDNGGQLNSTYIQNDGTHELHIMTPNTSRVRLVFQRNSPTSYGLETFYVDNVYIAKNKETYGGEFVSPIYDDWYYHEGVYTVSNNGRIYVQSSTPGHGMQKQFTGLDDQKTYKIRCKINPYQLGQMNIKIYSGGTAPSDVILDEDFATIYGSYREWDFSPANGFDWATVVITRVAPTTFSIKQFIMEEFTITESVHSVLPDQFIADIISTNDYYPFGMLKPGEQFSSPNYRYGFNGMEKDDEIKGNGNSYDFGARLYSSRIGKWMSIDSEWKLYPDISPYAFAVNNPIRYVDPDGNGVNGGFSIKNQSDRPVLLVGTAYKVTDVNWWPIDKAEESEPRAFVLYPGERYDLKSRETTNSDGEVTTEYYGLITDSEGNTREVSVADVDGLRLMCDTEICDGGDLKGRNDIGIEKSAGYEDNGNWVSKGGYHVKLSPGLGDSEIDTESTGEVIIYGYKNEIQIITKGENNETPSYTIFPAPTPGGGDPERKNKNMGPNTDTGTYVGEDTPVEPKGTIKDEL